MASNTVEFKTIAIDVSNYNLSAYNLPSYVLSQDRSRLFFYVQPQDYKRATPGSGYSLLATATGRQLKIGLKEVTFAVNIIRPELEIIQALETIAETALNTKTPIVIEDAVRPERRDISGISVRKGYIFAIRDTQGSVRSFAQNKILFPKGCGFTFTQLDLVPV